MRPLELALTIKNNTRQSGLPHPTLSLPLVVCYVSRQRRCLP